VKTNQIIIILKYLKYYFTSSTKHDIHSPFVFELLTTVIKSKTKHKLFESIEKTRKEKGISVLPPPVGGQAVQQPQNDVKK